jgi:hypothetical protein
MANIFTKIFSSAYHVEIATFSTVFKSKISVIACPHFKFSKKKFLVHLYKQKY